MKRKEIEIEYESFNDYILRDMSRYKTNKNHDSPSTTIILLSTPMLGFIMLVIYAIDYFVNRKTYVKVEPQPSKKKESKK